MNTRGLRATVASSMISDGNMSPLWEADGQGMRAVDHFRDFAEHNGFVWSNVVLMSLPQPFGDTIIEISTHDGWQKDDFGRKLARTDAFITRDRECVLALLTADCLPIVFEAEDIGAIGIAHCGWQSTSLELAKKVVQRLGQMGSDVGGLRVYIGPSIKGLSYVFDPENLGQRNVPAWQPFIHERTDGKFEVDVIAYNIAQLIEAGVPQEHIVVSDIDTAADVRYFSHYRIQSKKDRGQDPGEQEGRLVTIVGIRS